MKETATLTLSLWSAFQWSISWDMRDRSSCTKSRHLPAIFATNQANTNKGARSVSFQESKANML